MLDERATKRSDKSPDYTCANMTCVTQGANGKSYRTAIWAEKPTPAVPPFLHNAAAEDAAELAGKIGPKKPTMRDAYKDLTKWVLKEIMPLYAAEFGECGPEVAAACVQTLYIQACQSGKVE